MQESVNMSPVFSPKLRCDHKSYNVTVGIYSTRREQLYSVMT